MVLWALIIAITALIGGAVGYWGRIGAAAEVARVLLLVLTVLFTFVLIGALHARGF